LHCGLRRAERCTTTLKARKQPRLGLPQQMRIRNMTDLDSKFEEAVAASKKLAERPDDQTMLKIYALYKQASAGDVEGKRPGFSDMIGRAKWDAWNELKGTASEEAMQQYVDLIEGLKD
jgi:acyl-CoA-binding protein